MSAPMTQGEDEILPDSLEIFESATGRAMVLMSSKPKEIVVVGSKIEP